jgi:hypothetical protein
MDELMKKRRALVKELEAAKHAERNSKQTKA